MKATIFVAILMICAVINSAQPCMKDESCDGFSKPEYETPEPSKISPCGPIGTHTKTVSEASAKAKTEVIKCAQQPYKKDESCDGFSKPEYETPEPSKISPCGPIGTHTKTVSEASAKAKTEVIKCAQEPYKKDESCDGFSKPEYETPEPSKISPCGPIGTHTKTVSEASAKAKTEVIKCAQEPYKKDESCDGFSKPEYETPEPSKISPCEPIGTHTKTVSEASAKAKTEVIKCAQEPYKKDESCDGFSKPEYETPEPSKISPCEPIGTHTKTVSEASAKAKTEVIKCAQEPYKKDESCDGFSKPEYETPEPSKISPCEPIGTHTKTVSEASAKAKTEVIKCAQEPYKKDESCDGFSKPEYETPEPSKISPCEPIGTHTKTVSEASAKAKTEVIKCAQEPYKKDGRCGDKCVNPEPPKSSRCGPIGTHTKTVSKALALANTDV